MKFGAFGPNLNVNVRADFGVVNTFSKRMKLLWLISVIPSVLVPPLSKIRLNGIIYKLKAKPLT